MKRSRSFMVLLPRSSEVLAAALNACRAQAGFSRNGFFFRILSAGPEPFESTQSWHFARISSRSQARAYDQWRSAVRGAMPSASAACLLVRPAK